MISRGLASFHWCVESVVHRVQDLSLFDTVAALTLFLVVVFGVGVGGGMISGGFEQRAFRIASQVVLLGVLLHWPLLRNSALWAILAIIATWALVGRWYVSDNHKYLLVYWLWVVTIASWFGPGPEADRILRINARFFLVFIFLGAALQKWFSPRYMSAEMFEMCLLLDGRFRAFAHLVGIDKSVTDAALLNYTTLKSPLSKVINNELLLPATDRSRLVALTLTWYDLLVQVFIGACLLFNRRVPDLLAHAALLFFIFTTYLPAPVLGFGWTLTILGFTLSKDRFPRLALAYLAASVAVLLYQVPWRQWVLA
jgi:hypothetical protein